MLGVVEERLVLEKKRARDLQLQVLRIGGGSLNSGCIWEMRMISKDLWVGQVQPCGQQDFFRA